MSEWRSVQFLLVQLYCRELNTHLVEQKTTAHTVAKTCRLVENLLQHEVRETALLELSHIQLYLLNLRRDVIVLQVNNLDFLVAVKRCHLAVVKVNHVRCIFGNRRSV